MTMNGWRVIPVAFLCAFSGAIAAGQTATIQAILRQRVTASCEFAQPVTLADHDGYAFLAVAGTSKEVVFSPELGNGDVLDLTSNLPQSVLKTVRKSGFRVEQHAAPLAGSAQILSLNNNESCPTFEQASQMAAEVRARRRKDIQSKLYRPGTEDVTVPKPVASKTTGNLDGTNEGISAPPNKGTGGKGTSGTVSLSVIVGVDGKVHDPRVIKSLTEQMDKKAIEEVERWSFEPATMKGLPVPVLMQIEINFHLH